jgi:F-type H+-transporting ATPase subunit delta
MKITRTKLASVIAEKLQRTDDVIALSKEIATYLLSQGRISDLDSILRDVMQFRADQGFVEVVATDAHALSDAVKTDIKATVQKLYPGANQIIISEVVDTSVVGGVRLEFANSQLDLSVRSKLNRFKQLTASVGGI